MPTKPRSKLVGRAKALAEIEEERRRSAESGFRCVLLSADPGLGKTRLAGEVLDRNSRRMVCLSARAYPFGEASSFGMWVEAIDDHLQTLPVDTVKQLCGPFHNHLAALLPSVASSAGSAPPEQPAHIRSLEGLTELLRNLAGRIPLLVFLDDMHLSDPSSWETLHRVAHKLTAAPILVVIAVRPAEMELHSIGIQVLASLEQDGILRAVPITALGRQELEQLAEAFYGEVPSKSLVDWLAERSQGVPLFALGLLQALSDEGINHAQPSLGSLPDDLVAQVRVRLTRLDDRSQAMLETLAVYGRRVELKELGWLSGEPLDQVGPTLDILAKSRLVLETKRAASVSFEIAHPLIRDTIYQTIGAGRRMVLHRRIARGLMALQRPSKAVFHFTRSAEVGDAEAVSALKDALNEAERMGASREAVRILAGLVELLPSGDRRWLEILDAMSLDSPWAYDPSHDTYPEMGTKALRKIEAVVERTGDLGRLAAVKLRTSHLLAWGLAELDEAQILAEESVELFEKVSDTKGALAAASHLAMVKGFAGDLVAQKEESERVSKAATQSGNTYAEIQGLSGMGLAATWLGQLGEAEEPLRRSIEVPHPSRRTLSYSLGISACCAATAGRLEDAVRLLGQARKANPDYRQSILSDWASWIFWMAGDFPAALLSSREAASWNLGGTSFRRGLGFSFAALSALEMGRLEDARTCLGKANALYGDREFFWFSEVRFWARGVLEFRENALTTALKTLHEAAGRVGNRSTPFGALVLVDLCEAASLAEMPDLVDEASGRLQDIARQIREPLYQAFACMGGAWNRLITGNTEEAALDATEALNLLRPTEAWGFIGRAQDLLGQALSSVDRSGAVDSLESAIEVFGRCGASWRKDRALERLGALGTVGRKSANRLLGPEFLTRREREIARLAIQGHSAGAIAGRLFITDRTVEWHLSNVYAKLAVESRQELIRRFTELHL